MAAKSVLQRDLFGPPRRIRKSHDEEGEQIALVEWVGWRYPQAAPHLIHVPNGGRRGKLEAHRLRLMGVSRGFPDLLLLLPVGAYHGLAVELKATGATFATVRPDQRLWLARLAGQGYCSTVAYGLDHGQKIFAAYLEGEIEAGK